MRRLILVVILASLAIPVAHGRQLGGGGMGVAMGAGMAPPVQASATPTTRLYVRTIPAGAQVTLDGQPLGPSDGLFLVPAGTAKVAVGFGGQEPEVRQVEIAEGKITRVQFQLGAGGFGGGEGGIIGGGGIGGAVPGVPSGKLTSARKLAQPSAPLTPIDDLLAKPVDLSFTDAALRDLAAGIKQAVGCDVSFGLGPQEIDLDNMVTAQSHGISLEKFLNRTLHDRGLDWTVQDGVIEITRRDDSTPSLFTHVHDVSDLCDRADGLQTLMDLVSGAIAPETWENVGGGGVISMDLTDDGASLVVLQTLAVQRRIVGFLDTLRKLKSQPVGERQTLSAEGCWSDSERTVAIRAALARPLKGKVEFTKKSLREVAESLTEASGMPVLVDRRACDDAGINLDEQRISFTGRDLPLGRLLDRLLHAHDMDFVVEDDQFMITTAEAAGERLSVAIYPMDRLLAKGRNLQGIAHMVKVNVIRNTWDENGGYGKVTPVGGDVPCLVVHQTTAGHRAVTEFLGSLK